jgi:putative PIN family toxin of toxin-antitoxin system
MTSEKLGSVFDCMVFVQALANDKGPAFACWQSVKQGQVVLFVSPEVLAELRDVLGRPRIQRRLPAITTERATAYLQDLEAHSVLLTDVPQAVALPRDPKDERYVNLAVAANARFLVSRDRDLLDLMKADTPEAQAFRQRFPNLLVVDPVAFLKELSTRPPSPEPQAGTEEE